MKNYLITGGAGFIGSNYIHYLINQVKDANIFNLDALTYAGNLENLVDIEKDPRYHFIQCDLLDEQGLHTIFENNQFDYIVNFAAESHVDRSIENPTVFAKTNILGTLNLLNNAKSQWDKGNGYAPGCKFLQVSTDEVYGTLGDEGYFTEDRPLDPHSPYSASKASADFFVKAYHDTFGIPISITRCSNNYGPYQFPEKFIPLIINNALQLKPIPVYGDGCNVRDWLYVEDHCKAIELVLRKGISGEIYNIGGHNEKKNIDIVKTILNYLSDKVDKKISENLIQYVSDRKGHDWRYAIDPEKIFNDFSWKPCVTFEEGIVKTIDWYLANKSWLDNVTNGSYKEYYNTMYGGKQ